MKKPFIIHPLLFAAYPALFLFSRNIRKVPGPYAFLAIGVIITAAILIWLFLNLIFKNKIKAGLLTSIILFWALFYGYFFDLGIGLNLFGFLIWRHIYIFPVWTLVFGPIVALIIRSHKSFNNLTRVLNVISTMLIILCSVDIGAYIVKNKILASKQQIKEDAFPKKDIFTEKLKPSASAPDVYYIILDMYASYDTLKEFYNFDNRQFCEFLVERGFYIADKSRSNYPSTYFSLASSLNMKYLDKSPNKNKTRSRNRLRYRRMIKNNAVMRFLKSSGYKYINVAARNEFADLNLFYKQGNEFNKYLFTNYLLQTTFLKYFANLYGFGFETGHREGILYAFDKLAEVNNIKAPKFVFAHILCPHKPYVFAPDGRATTLIQAIKLSPREMYVRQLIFINKKVEGLINTILSRSDNKPIIILQADHGPRISVPHLLREQYLKENLTIFNAYYLPDRRYDILYNSITPVNTFRIIFNHYFHTNYELLEDESYTYLNGEFINVTDKLKSN